MAALKNEDISWAFLTSTASRWAATDACSERGEASRMIPASSTGMRSFDRDDEAFMGCAGPSPAATGPPSRSVAPSF